MTTDLKREMVKGNTAHGLRCDLVDVNTGGASFTGATELSIISIDTVTLFS